MQSDDIMRDVAPTLPMTSLLDDLDRRSVLVDPTGVVSLGVAPTGLELVAHSPHEVALDVAVEDVHDTVTKAVDLVAWIVGGVHSACAVLDDGVVKRQASLSEWAQNIGGAVEVSTILLQVGVGTLDALAIATGWGVGIVEASEPKGADIGGKRPFANPHIVLEVLSVADVAAVLVTVLTDVSVDAAPGEVLVCVHDDVLVVIVSKEVVPNVWIEVESVVEDELQAGLVLMDHGSHISVEGLQHVEVRAPPWFVDGLDGVESLVFAPGVEESLDGVLGKVNVVLVD